MVLTLFVMLCGLNVNIILCRMARHDSEKKTVAPQKPPLRTPSMSLRTALSPSRKVPPQKYADITAASSDTEDDSGPDSPCASPLRELSPDPCAVPEPEHRNWYICTAAVPCGQYTTCPFCKLKVIKNDVSFADYQKFKYCKICDSLLSAHNVKCPTNFIDYAKLEKSAKPAIIAKPK